VRRRIFNLVSLVSLLLCVATVVLWVRSYRVLERWVWAGAASNSDTYRRGISLSRGIVAMSSYRLRANQSGSRVVVVTAGWPVGRSISRPIEFAGPRYLGFGWHHERRNRLQNFDWWTGYVPVWALFVLTAALPCAWTRGYLKCLRSARDCDGVCRICSYDLTGNVSGVCPECGVAVGKAGA